MERTAHHRNVGGLRSVSMSSCRAQGYSTQDSIFKQRLNLQQGTLFIQIIAQQGKGGNSPVHTENII